jgi:hypothetical protein
MGRWLLSVLPICAIPSHGWTCVLDSISGITLEVEEAAPYAYRIFQAGGSDWLDGGSLSFFNSGVEYASNSSNLIPYGPAASGIGEDSFGAYSFFSVLWGTTDQTSITALSNFSCYGEVAVFGLTFPGGLPNSSIVPPPHSGNYEAPGNAVPTTRFPSFAAGPTDAAHSAGLGYVEYAGCMSSQRNSVGKDLNGFIGGQQSGPLVLFNASGYAAGLLLVWRGDDHV